MRQGLMLLLLAALLAPHATAQKIARAEQGSVPLALGPFAGTHQTVTVKPGETAWTETVRPIKAVRLLADAPKRIRPNKVEGPLAGTVLFGYRLSNGMAYCPPIDLAKLNRDVQCFRDLDGDGTFDGGYVTNDTAARARYFSSFLRGLTAIPKLRYEPAASEELPEATVRMVFTGFKKGAPQFNMFMDKARMDTTLECFIREPGVCDVLGVRVAFAATSNPKGGVTLSFQTATSTRTFDVFDPSNHLER